MDHPNNRSSHSIPTPRGGGISFVIVAIFASFVALLTSTFVTPTQFPLVCAAFLGFPLALVGFFDDRYNLPSSWRYFVQLLSALLIILLSPLHSSHILFIPFMGLLLISVTAVINFTNFMDGLDGLVSGCMTLLISAAAFYLDAPFPIWALVGALVGFLFWNWSPAKVFMGDVGSTFLGAVFAVLVLQAPTWLESFGLLLVATPLLGDACFCVLRRLMAGQPVFQAHRLHLYQRLHQAGWSHARVSLLYMSFTTVHAILLLLVGVVWVTIFAALELLIAFWLDQRVAVPFTVASLS